MPDMISISDLQTITQLNAGVEDRKAASCIVDAHLELEKVLGKTGYAIVYAAAPSFTTLAPNASAYVTLLNSYIKPFMAWRARERGLWDMYAEPDRAGIYVNEGDEHRAVRSSEMTGLEQTYGARASERLKRLIDHLCDNTSTFTWYTTNVNGEERIDKTNSKSVAGLSFRRAERQDHYRG